MEITDFTFTTTDAAIIVKKTSPRPSDDINITVLCEDMNDYLWEERNDLTTRSLVMIVFAALYSLIILLGLFGNFCVILAITRVKSLRTVPNMFIFSLSCSDILVCFISATITPITAFRKDWIFGHFLCSFAPFVAGTSLCFSTFTLAAISIDRFILILFPTSKAFTHSQALIIISIICLLASGFSLPSSLFMKLKPVANYCGLFCFEDWDNNSATRRVYGTLMLTVQFIIPLVIITFCYAAISLRLGKRLNLRSNRKECNWHMPVSAQQNAASKRRQRTNRMFIAMTVIFAMSWISSVLYNLLRDYDILPEIIRKQEFFFGILTHSIAMSSTVWNPILYALLNLQLRAAFLQLIPECIKNSFRRICCKDRKNNRTDSAVSHQRNSMEATRLLDTNNIHVEAMPSSENKKRLICFLNSSGSIESTTVVDVADKPCWRQNDGIQSYNSKREPQNFHALEEETRTELTFSQIQEIDKNEEMDDADGESVNEEEIL